MPENSTPTEQQAAATTVTPPAPSTEGAPATGAPLGPGAESAIAAERQARQVAETSLAEFAGMSKTEIRNFIQESKAAKTQIDALKAAFLGEGADPKEDVVATLQKQVEAIQRDSLVNTVARRHGITNDDDVALLRVASDEAHMVRLAERLKAPPGPTVPAPDPGQGARPTTPQAERDAEYSKYFPN